MMIVFYMQLVILAIAYLIFMGIEKDYKHFFTLIEKSENSKVS